MDSHTLLNELATLVAMPSHKDPRPVLQYVAQRLPFLPWQWQPVAPEEGLYNLYALVPGTFLVINTHVDTVPPLGMEEPWRLRVVDGLAYGRGVVDTKGLLAALIVALEAFYQKTGRVPASVALTVDEEQTSARGSTALAPRLRGREVLVLEPSQGQVCLQQAGALEFRLTARGEPVHAAVFSRGVNPVRVLMDLWPEMEARLGLPVNVLQFQGGWEHYVTPPNAHVLAEVLLPAGRTWREAEASLLDLFATPPWRHRINYERVDAEDPLDLGGRHAAIWLARAYERVLGTAPPQGTMPSWTDAAAFVRAGVPSVVFGFGDLAVAHTPREAIAVDDLTRMAQVLYSLFSILTQ
ncbi:MAG: M20 family metallopeptidase [Chloroflexi bacterium]|nr:M20 family metallopeptidase [Chloroflexota bacterium]